MARSHKASSGFKASGITDRAMVRVAIAGTNGFAQFLAHYLSEDSYHQFFFLSRYANPALEAKGWQVLRVDYNNQEDLRFKLAGVDTVISTISGNAQLHLIDAAVNAHVRRFVPSEFEGRPSHRPSSGDALDRGKKSAISRLQHYSQYNMSYTIFVCGVFYERFGPGGMAAKQIGKGTFADDEGDYLIDIGRLEAEFPHRTSSGQHIYLCMTSAQDVAKYIVAALDVSSWPTEIRMKGDRMSIKDLVRTAESMRGRSFHKTAYSESTIQNLIAQAASNGDNAEQWRLHQLLATARERYDYGSINSHLYVEMRWLSFRDWLASAWSQ